MDTNYLATAFRVSPVPTIILNYTPKACTIVDANEIYCKTTGIALQTLRGSDVLGLQSQLYFDIQKESVSIVMKSLESVVKSQGSDRVQLQVDLEGGKKAEAEIDSYFIGFKEDASTLIMQTIILKPLELPTQIILDTLTKYKLIVDHSPSAIFLSRPDGTILEANKAACDLFGYTEEELRELGRMGIIDHTEQVVQHKLEERRKRGRSQGEITGIKKGGIKFPIEFSSVIFSISDGVEIASTTIHDISHRKKVEEQLIKSEQRFKSLVQDGADLIGILDLSGNYTYVSPTSINVLGFHPESFIGKNAFTFIHEDDVESVTSAFNKLADEKRITIGPFRFKHNDGSWRWLETTVVNLLDDPAVEGIVANSRDVTEKIEAFKSIHESYERYRFVTNATEDAIWDWDLLADTIFWGEGFQTMFGFDLATCESKSTFWTDRIHPEDVDRVIESIDRVLKGRENNWKEEYRYRNGKGLYVYVIDRGIVLRDAMGNAVRMVGSMRDISRQKNEELQNEVLTEIGQLFSNPAADLHHICTDVANLIRKFTNDKLIEIWLLSPDKKKLSLFTMVMDDAALQRFYHETIKLRSFEKGVGLPGVVWEQQSIQRWENIAVHQKFVRSEAAQLMELQAVVGVPLIYGIEFIGVLVLGSMKRFADERAIHPIFYGFADKLAAEIRRKQLENELSLIFNTCPDAICIAGPNGFFTKVNPAFCKLLGYSAQELTEQPFTDFLYSEDQRATVLEYEETIGGRRDAQGFVNRYVTKSGDVKWISWNSSPFLGEDGHSFAYGRDVTDTKQLQDLLNAANRLARIGGWEVNFETETVILSDITREIHEVDSDYIPTLESGINFYREDLRHVVEECIRLAIQEGKPWDFDLPIITAKGNERWVRSIGKAELKNGVCKKLLGSFQDIHAQKVAEENSLKVLKDKNAILESISDAFFAVDHRWMITYWNKEAERILGKSKSEVLGRNLWDLYADAVDSIFYQKYHTALSEGMPVHFDARYDALDMWVEISAYPSAGGLSVYFKDVTERKKAEQQILKMNTELTVQAKQLTLSNTELEQFAYVASHDLQEPLRMVSSFLTQLEKNYKAQLDERAGQYINFAVDGAQRMRQIILDLLDYSRIGRLKEQKETIDLNELIEELRSLYRSQIEESKAEILVNTLPSLFSYKAPVRQVLHNIFSNALKYHNHNQPPRIKIEVREEDEQWIFSIADNGIGIHKDYHDKIFVIFQRLHARNEYPGTGMGLTICKKIVENLGGNIWVESAEGKGSTFYFTIHKHADA